MENMGKLFRQAMSIRACTHADQLTVNLFEYVLHSSQQYTINNKKDFSFVGLRAVNFRYLPYCIAFDVWPSPPASLLLLAMLLPAGLVIQRTSMFIYFKYKSSDNVRILRNSPETMTENERRRHKTQKGWPRT